MHVLAVLVAAVLIHVVIVRAKLPLAVLFVGAVAVLVGASAIARPGSVWQSVAGAVVAFVALAAAVRGRQMRRVVDALSNLTWHPGAVPADGAGLVEDLEVAGFQVADDGWARADALEWCVVALRRGPLRAFVVSGQHGPTLDVTTVLDNGRTLLTTPSARLRVSADVVRQCIPTTDPHELITRHEDALAAAAAAGRRPLVPDTARLTAEAIADELEHGRHVLAGGVPASLVSVWRELTSSNADEGPVTERPDDWARLVADPT